MQYRGPEAGQLQHLVAGDRLHQLGIGHLARVCGEHTRHIGVDLAGVSPQGSGQGHGRGVGAAAAQGGDLGHAAQAVAGALEARHHHHVAVAQQPLQSVGAHFEDAGAAVGRFGEDAHLRACHGHGRHPEGVQGHGEQSDRHLFARGQQHVHLPLRRIAADRPGQPGEFVGGVTHGRHHDHQVVAGLAAAGDAPGHRLDALRIGHRGAPEFLNQQGHGSAGRRRLWRSRI